MAAQLCKNKHLIPPGDRIYFIRKLCRSEFIILLHYLLRQRVCSKVVGSVIFIIETKKDVPNVTETIRDSKFSIN